MEELRDVCWQLNVPVEDEMLSLLMSYCEAKEHKIDYIKFANFLNWKDKMPQENITAPTNGKNSRNIICTTVQVGRPKV